MDQPQDNHSRPLTAEELEALKRDMRDASMWMRAELRRRAECRRGVSKVGQLLTPGGG
jgi:hypothetical protein